MDEKITKIKEWLGTGSINIFGLPFSGKDTIGIRLAQDLGGRLLSSGIILRAAEQSDAELMREMDYGHLASTNKFRDIVLPYFYREDLKDFCLILSSVGRMSGEEPAVMDAAVNSGHEIKLALLLNVSENEIKKRWEAAQSLEDRGTRADDKNRAILETRIEEFKRQTMPVIASYQKLGKLIAVSATGERDAVYEQVVNQIYDFATRESS